MSPHESFFSHNITRPYPFRWFTPVVLGGGIIVTVLVSFLNVAASGYELVTTSTTDPKGVRSGAEWFDSWPKWLASTRASCDPATMPLQTSMYTNKTAFLYTLASVQGRDEWFAGLGKRSGRGALIYDDDTLSWCNVTSLRINIDSNLQTAGQLSQSSVGAALTMNIECLVERPGENTTYLDLVTTHELVSQGIGSGLGAVGVGEASFFGAIMLSTYWKELATKYYLENVNLDRPFYKAEVTLERTAGARSMRPVTMEEIVGMDFLSVDSCWLVPLNSTGFSHADEYCNDRTISELAQNGTDDKVLPSIWQPLSMLGTAMWFAVLADLGRDDHILPNILTHPQEVRNLTKVDFILGPYDDAQPKITPSVFSTTYICQVPRLKSTGTLIVSVLVADLVMLQTIWKIFVLAVDHFVASKEEESIYCEGCARNLKEKEKSDSDGVVKSHAPLTDEVAPKV